MRFGFAIWFWGILLGCLALMALRLGGMSSQYSTTAAAQFGEVALTPAAEAALWEPSFVGPPIPPPPDDATRTIAAALSRGDSIDRSLKHHHVPSHQLKRLYEALYAVFDPAQVKPGDYYEIAIDTSDVIRRFCYTPHRTPDRPIEVELRDGQFVARQLQLPLERRVERLEVHIENNLSNAISEAGEGSALSDLVADDIFGAVIDFQRDPRRGDRLGIVFEKLYLDERFVRYGHVLLARYEGERVTELAVRYAPAEGEDAYYNASGRSLGRMFVLKAPWSQSHHLALQSPTLPSHTQKAAAPFGHGLRCADRHPGVDYGPWTGCARRSKRRLRQVSRNCPFQWLPHPLRAPEQDIGSRRSARTAKRDHRQSRCHWTRDRPPPALRNHQRRPPHQSRTHQQRQCRPKSSRRPVTRFCPEARRALACPLARLTPLGFSHRLLDIYPALACIGCLAMELKSLQEIENLAERDGRYKRDAYLFVYDALEYTVQKLGKDALASEKRHISGRDLLFGISEHSADQFGPLTCSVFAHWGVEQTRDFGEIVFNLVGANLLRKTDEDRIEDFIDVYDFAEEFDWKKRKADLKRLP